MPSFLTVKYWHIHSKNGYLIVESGHLGCLFLDTNNVTGCFRYLVLWSYTSLDSPCLW